MSEDPQIRVILTHSIRRTVVQEALVVFLGLCTWLVIGLTLFYFCDLHWSLGTGLRSVGLALLVLPALIGSVWGLQRIFNSRRNLLHQAQNLENANPDLQGRLLTCLLSRRGNAAALATLGREIAVMKLQPAPAPRSLKVALWSLAAAVFCLLISNVVAAPPLAISAARLTLPWTDLPRPTATRIAQILPAAGETVDAEGEWMLRATTQGVTPKSGRVKMSRHGAAGPWVDYPFVLSKAGEYSAILPAAQGEVSLQVEIGDAITEPYQVLLRRPPLMSKTRISLSPPPYSSLPRSEIEAKDFSAWTGTQAVFTVNFDQAVKKAKLWIYGQEHELSIDVTGKKAVSKALLLDRSTLWRLDFSAKDAPFSVKSRFWPIKVLEDQPPLVVLETPLSNEIELQKSQPLEIVWSATDDQGLMSVNLESQERFSSEVKSIRLASSLTGASAQGKNVLIPSRELGAKAGDLILVHLSACDARGPISKTYSKLLKIKILPDPEKQNQQGQDQQEKQGQGQDQQEGKESQDQGQGKEGQGKEGQGKEGQGKEGQGQGQGKEGQGQGQGKEGQGQGQGKEGQGQGQGKEGQGKEGQGQGQGKEGQGKEGQGKEGQGKEGQGKEGQGKEGQGQGQGKEGQGQGQGKEGQGQGQGKEGQGQGQGQGQGNEGQGQGQGKEGQGQGQGKEGQGQGQGKEGQGQGQGKEGQGQGQGKEGQGQGQGKEGQGQGQGKEGQGQGQGKEGQGQGQGQEGQGKEGQGKEGQGQGQGKEGQGQGQGKEGQGQGQGKEGQGQGQGKEGQGQGQGKEGQGQGQGKEGQGQGQGNEGGQGGSGDDAQKEDEDVKAEENGDSVGSSEGHNKKTDAKVKDLEGDAKGRRPEGEAAAADKGDTAKNSPNGKVDDKVYDQKVDVKKAGEEKLDKRRGNSESDNAPVSEENQEIIRDFKRQIRR